VYNVAGKYYLVDSGYRNQVGYLAPYKGQTTRYHVAEFRGGAAPQGIAETFNYAHSSLRNVVEVNWCVETEMEDVEGDS
jgi:hypothetical protein